MEKFCGKCNRFQPHYRKLLCNFFQEHTGICAATDELKNENDACEFWNPRPDKNAQVSVEQLEEAEENVKILLSIFCEEQ